MDIYRSQMHVRVSGQVVPREWLDLGGKNSWRGRGRPDRTSVRAEGWMALH